MHMLLGAAGEAARQTWLLCNALGAGRLRELALQAQQAGRGLVPWAGIAAPLSLPSGPQPALPAAAAAEDGAEAAGTDGAAEGQPQDSLLGQAFCFLPLPCATGAPFLPTPTRSHLSLRHVPGVESENERSDCTACACREGLPVHVNGYFEVTSNRRSIWYSDATDGTLSGDGRLRSDWNVALLEVLRSEFAVRVAVTNRHQEVIGTLCQMAEALAHRMA